MPKRRSHRAVSRTGRVVPASPEIHEDWIHSQEENAPCQADLALGGQRFAIRGKPDVGEGRVLGGECDSEDSISFRDRCVGGMRCRHFIKDVDQYFGVGQRFGRHRAGKRPQTGRHPAT